jgi:hypothetical protein
MVRSVFVSSTLCLLLSVLGCASARPPWTAQEILREVGPELQRFDGVTEPVSEAHILMWQVERDARRDFIVEEALLWTRSETRPQRTSWALVHAFRHPFNDNAWHRSVSYLETKDESHWPHTRVGYRQCQAQPSATDVCAFLQHIRGLGSDSGFSHMSGGFPKAAWQRFWVKLLHATSLVKSRSDLPDDAGRAPERGRAG